MSEPKGPFEGSLDMLRRKWSLIRGSRWAKKDYKDAIHVLEAAEKVDKERALWNLDEAFSEGRDHVLMMAPYKQDHNLEEYNRAEKEITALVESLPDGGKK